MEGFTLALSANLLFSFSSFFIAKYTVRFGSVWTNTFKNSIALLCFLLCALLINPYGFPDLKGNLLLILSGVIGLAIGDIFILKAFATLGSTRVLVLYGLTPFFVALIRYFTLGNELLISEIIPVLFFSLCLLSFARERKKLLGSWDLKSLALGTFGVFLDAMGVVLTRIAFEENQGLSTFHANTIRCLGSIVVLFIFLKLTRKNFFSPIKMTKSKDRMLLFTIPVTGTFLSLLCYLQAIKVGNLVIVTALGVSGPILSSIIESIAEKKWPSKYLVISIILFCSGVLTKVYLL